MRRKQRRTRGLIFIAGVLLASFLIFLGNMAVVRTSKDEYCAKCHVHPHSTQSWKLSTHVDNKRGIKVHCVDCHLPPHGEGYLVEKAKTGARDLWSHWFKDPESFDWEAKSQIEYARKHSFQSSCIHCHENNYPLGLSKEGREAHLYYESRQEELHCINCHITVGHHDPKRLHAKNVDFGTTAVSDREIYAEAASIEGFDNYSEYIPGTSVSFEMIAIPGGSFIMGSPEDEPFRKEHEGPQREITLHPFFMAKIEVTWDEYLAFFKETGAHGKTSDAYLSLGHVDVDAISGPTPPWGAPDQGWGTGDMPAITMTHHAATVYCQWLSKVCGKTYRLPTEAEWEYAARGGTTTPYFFEGDPKRYVREGLRNKLFGVDTSGINTYVRYIENSKSRTSVPIPGSENPFGLINMLGNAAEFCSDYYHEKAYETPSVSPLNPNAQADGGKEHVVRGGSYRDEASGVRSAARDHTRTEAWLKTDPQIPKSIWWYSNCTHVSFRVVCEYSESDNSN